MSLLRTLVVSLALLCTALPVAAQIDLIPGLSTGGGGEGTETDQTAAADQGTSPALSSLLEVLKDPEARDALIAELEGALAAGDPEGTDGPADPATDQEPPPAAEPQPPAPSPAAVTISLARELAEITQKIAQDAAQSADRFWTAVKRLPTTLLALEALIDPEVLSTAVSELLFVVIVTYGGYLTLRVAGRWVDRRIAATAAEGNLATRVGLSLFSLVCDVTVAVLAWAIGYGVMLALSGDAGSIGIRQSLYLNAFLLVCVARALLRWLFSPREPALRLLPLRDSPARKLMRWSGISVFVLAYGHLLAVPIVNRTVSYLAGAAVARSISLLVVLSTLFLVVRYRRSIADWLRTPDPKGAFGRMRNGLAGLWHLPVLAYLLFLFAVVATRPGGILITLLQSAGIALGLLTLGALLVNWTTQLISRGVRLPGAINARLPLMERRLNTFLPQVLMAARLIVVLAMGAVALDHFNIADVGGYLSSPAGRSTLAVGASVFVLLLVSFLLWLALSSWVDYRLNPDYGSIPTARETTLLTLLRNAVTIALVVITLMFTLSELGLNIAPLIASAGVLGLAIGFGAQKLVQDVITGIFIQFENAINVGDVVTAGGTTGVVEKLTVRSVSLRDVNGIFHIVPFSSVDLVSNYMRDFSYHVEDMGVAYREDIDTVRTAMEDAFTALKERPEFGPDIIGEMEWFGVQTLADSAVVVRARIKTMPGKQWGIGRAFKEQCKRIFDARNIEIPFPHQTIYWGEDHEGNAPPLRVAGASDTRSKPVEVTPQPTEARPAAPVTEYDFPRSDDEATPTTTADEDSPR
ncbi:MAG: mechanosensitive ion channel domain-containing protein [Pseudomonadota bacterium]